METRLPSLAMFTEIDGLVRRRCEAPLGLAVDGTLIGTDAPSRPIPLAELRSMLLERSTSYATRDRALLLVAGRARDEADPWSLVLTWLLLPGLQRMRERLVVAGADRSEAEAELVCGVFSAVHDRPRLPRQGVAASLCWHAYRVSRGGLGLDDVAPLSIDLLSWTPAAPPPSSSASVEAVLEAAVERGVMTRADAELVAATRLDDRRLDDLAADLSVRPDTLQRRRARAEARLAATLDGATWKVVPRDGQLGVRWSRIVAVGAAARRAAAAYRARPGGRRGAPALASTAPRPALPGTQAA